ncbi:uncharacterized protein LOC142318265 [Lycorma delicatula]|uniref:uncharacterized protein LOC142318265 n=1 Tax=Lycorma delicatula TaxID=130591 RepID=UPI003F517AB9
MVKINMILLLILPTLFMKITTGATISIPSREVRIEQFQQCPDMSNTTIVFKDIVLSMVARNIIDLSGKLQINEKIGIRQIQITFELSKCSSKQDVSTCEYYTRVKMNNVCTMIDKFKDFMKASTIPNHCPIEAGVYYLNHTQINMQQNFLPLFDSYWKVRNTLVENKKVILCVVIEFSMKKMMRKVRI